MNLIAQLPAWIEWTRRYIDPAVPWKLNVTEKHLPSTPPWHADKTLLEIWRSTDDEGFLEELAVACEQCVVAAPEDIGTRFVVLHQYYLRRDWATAGLRHADEDDEDEKAEVLARINLALGHFTSLLPLEDCPRSWPRLRWEIINCYAAGLWDRAADMFDFAERVSVLPDVDVRLMRGHFRYLLACMSDARDEALDDVVWEPRVLGSKDGFHPPKAFTDEFADRIARALLYGNAVGAVGASKTQEHASDVLHDCRNDLDKAVATNAKVNPVYQAMLARCCLELGDFANAAQHFDALVGRPIHFGEVADRHDFRPMLHLQVARAYRAAAQAAAAGRALARGLREYPSDRQLLMESADLAAQETDYVQAFRSLKAAAEADPELNRDLGVRLGVALGDAFLSAREARESLTAHQRAVVDAYEAAKRCRVAAQDALRQWIVRHNKGAFWPGTCIGRRRRVDGAAVAELKGSTGLPIPPDQLLPFFLAARSAVKPGQDLLGEALCSSFEAFRFTRENRKAARDEDDEALEPAPDLSHAGWYLAEFDHALKQSSGATHPKMHATVRKVVDLWAKGEKVLVFAFYRHTCRALRIHISEEVDRRVTEAARQRLRNAGQKHDDEEVERLLETTQRRYFDDAKSPGRRAVDAALAEVLHAREAALEASGLDSEQRDALMDVMRRFLRVRTTLLRFFPIAELDSADPPDAVRRTLDYTDDSGASWRSKFDRFVDFLTDQCTPDERRLYLDAAARTQTGGIRVEGETEGDARETPDAPASTVTLANVQVATGDTERATRSRLMRAFNTPFFPDIFVCSEVMGEGVDLQRFCRHVIHHDLAWNPSSIEQRTGRIDRLGCAAEGRHPIMVYLPYLAGTADERQYRVMSDREQWFRVVMGQDEVARLITPDSAGAAPLPPAIAEGLSFRLDVQRSSP